MSEKNENTKQYHYNVSTKVLADSPNSLDSKMDNEINNFLKSNPEFQKILNKYRANPNLKKIKDEIYCRESKDQVINEDREPRYIKLYIAQLSHIIELKNIEKKVFLAIIEADFISVKGYVQLNSKRKKIIAKLLNHNDTSNVYPALQELQKPLKSLNNTPVLLRIENEEHEDDGMEKYYINPYIVGNGSWANVQNRRLRITLDCQTEGQKLTIENLDRIENFNTDTVANCSDNTHSNENDEFDDLFPE